MNNFMILRNGKVVTRNIRTIRIRTINRKKTNVNGYSKILPITIIVLSVVLLALFYLNIRLNSVIDIMVNNINNIKAKIAILLYENRSYVLNNYSNISTKISKNLEKAFRYYY